MGSVKNRPPQNSGVRLKPPSFNGKTDPRHFSVKLLNYMETYKVHSEYEKIRILNSCLEDSALDLYLFLEDHELCDLIMLEKTFQQYFKPFLLNGDISIPISQVILFESSCRYFPFAEKRSDRGRIVVLT